MNAVRPFEKLKQDEISHTERYGHFERDWKDAIHFKSVFSLPTANQLNGCQSFHSERRAERLSPMPAIVFLCFIHLSAVCNMRKYNDAQPSDVHNLWKRMGFFIINRLVWE